MKITLIIPDERIRKIGFSKKMQALRFHHAQNIEKVGYFDIYVAILTLVTIIGNNPNLKQFEYLDK